MTESKLSARVDGWLAIFIFLSLWAIPRALLGADRETERAAALVYSQQSHLADDLHWQRLLYYSPRMVGKPRSLIDSKHFFLAKSGKVDPHAELLATIAGIYATTGASEEENIACRYPARFRFLKSHLHNAHIELPESHCPQLEAWLKWVDPYSISLVFSSYFLNNPASMMGHTLLRIHRGGSSTAGAKSPLLDLALGFSANQTTDNALLMPILGLSGGFKGTFSLLLYYKKVQEYNNAESRDLWEYELNLSQDEISYIISSIWEVGPQWIDYYYLDQNCATILLYILETGSPRIDLSSPFFLYAIPEDTAKIVARMPGLVTKVDYRASNRRKFQSRYEKLTERERAIFDAIVEAPNNPGPLIALSDSANATQIRVIDTALDYVDYKELLYGNKKPVTYNKLRANLLTLRTTRAGSSNAVVDIPSKERPDLGAMSRRLGLALGRRQNYGNIALFEYRPTLHELNSSSLGYSDEIGIEMMRMEAVYYAKSHTVELQSLHFVEILSLNLPKPKEFPLSWELSLGSERVPLTTTNRDSSLVRLRGGPGLTFALFHNRIIGYGNLVAEAGGKSADLVDGLYGALGSSVGCAWIWSDKMRLLAKWYGLKSYGSIDEIEEKWQINLNYTASESQELRLSWQKWNKLNSLLLYFFNYY